MEKTSKQTNEAMEMSLKAEFGGLLVKASAETSIGTTRTKENKNARRRCEQSVLGGEGSLLLAINDDNADAVIEEWGRSVDDENLGMLGMKLEYSWELVKAINPTYGAQYEEYLKKKWGEQDFISKDTGYVAEQDKEVSRSGRGLSNQMPSRTCHLPQPDPCPLQFGPIRTTGGGGGCNCSPIVRHAALVLLSQEWERGLLGCHWQRYVERWVESTFKLQSRDQCFGIFSPSSFHLVVELVSVASVLAQIFPPSAPTFSFPSLSFYFLGLCVWSKEEESGQQWIWEGKHIRSRLGGKLAAKYLGVSYNSGSRGSHVSVFDKNPDEQGQQWEHEIETQTAVDHGGVTVSASSGSGKLKNGLGHYLAVEGNGREGSHLCQWTSVDEGGQRWEQIEVPE